MRSIRRVLHVPVAAAILTVLAATVSPVPVAADPNNNNSAKLRQAVTLAGVRQHQLAWQQIATANGGNRFAGLPGHDASVAYVTSTLEGAGYTVTLQEFEYFAFVERTPSQLEQVSPTATTYVNGIDFRIMNFSGSGDVTSPVTPVDIPGTGLGSGCELSDFAGFTFGNIALVRRGGCTFRVKTDNATAANASAILIYNNVPGVINGRLNPPETLAAIPSLGLTDTLGQQLAATPDLVMHVKTDTTAEQLTTHNVFAETPDGDPNNVVMVGGHLDSVSAGPGINDNGSGSAAILEVALQMAKVKPRNKVRFAWWSAEESGLVGSTYYVTHLSEAELNRIALYLNFDMVGSPNFARFVYDGDNSTGAGTVGPAGSDIIEQRFVAFFQSQGLASEPTPFNGRSDYGPFINAGIPAGGLFTGAEGIKTAAQAAAYGGTAGVAYDPCYHAACDTYANNSDPGLDQMADAIADAVISYAQNTEAINAIRGKGNFKRVPVAANGSGTGGGGGLHGDHDLVAI